ncbi:hypothetical protein MPTK1_5g21760 [Marchantia polymorpha subsp. ruderalis]|uniref:Patatin n=2 Tax=Marchantia polymorpha TaxID=3197 RepID=A0A176WEX0_MARPO|nr:hypothetical protein AXG93_3943s1230 [Marchantia polymorpha subsp. ruderalis]PTQ31823.1 hypothetical protein MARPO_0106s0023 [Marchantia polymorpha]BBN12648.1 hypothetical protein Mp_5g21760 [Marchantia polymorpha subsp. ruderalis]|eukprot:PTQ31823.1 hypothetical protein MARPO_0106s0023 [Marchantia polymorpha]
MSEQVKLLSEGPSCQGVPGKRLTILSVDGGGVRGVIPAVCLEYLEKQLQELDGPEARVADYFDIVAGTSTGGLIASMLTAPNENKRPMMTTTQVKQFYLDRSKDIFGLRNGLSFLPDMLGSLLRRSPKYKADNLKKMLEEEFKDLRIKDAVTDVLLTTFDAYTQQPVFFDKQAATRNFKANAKLRDACLATAAAPTYFPAHNFKVPYPEDKISHSGTDVAEYHLVDGGVVANNPTDVAILHAIKDLRLGDSPHKERMPNFKGYQDLLVLSLGTGARTVTYKASDINVWSDLDWVSKPGQPIVQMLMNSSAYLVDYDISIRFQIDGVKENYLRLESGEIDENTVAMDNVKPENMKKLVELGNSLLAKKPKFRNAITGALEEVPDFETNKEALESFARWLVEEKRARA